MKKAIKYMFPVQEHLNNCSSPASKIQSLENDHISNDIELDYTLKQLSCPLIDNNFVKKRMIKMCVPIGYTFKLIIL